RSLASLTPRDVLISPELGALTAGDFIRVRDFIALGDVGAQRVAPRLASLALPPEAYAQWRASRPRGAGAPARLAYVGFQGSTQTEPSRHAADLQTQPGKPFDADQAERDARLLAATGDYTRADYRLVSGPEGDGLMFELADKPWGPHYFRVGLDL